MKLKSNKKFFLNSALFVSFANLWVTACMSRGQFGADGEPDEQVDGAELAATPSTPAASGFWARSSNLKEAELYTRTPGTSLDAGLNMMDFIRPVLKGVLYRGGFNGAKGAGVKTGGLTLKHQQTLCKIGITNAFSYLDLGTNQNASGKCGSSSQPWEYDPGSQSDYSEFLKTVWEAINTKTPAKKVFVHCRWGVHASGFAATAALAEFCSANKDGSTAPIDFGSKKRALAYWDKARNNSPASSTWFDDHWNSYIKHKSKTQFETKITKAQQDEICPH